jgi:ABC-type phosphate/phosphonate transport system substrate-binding protein
MEPGDYFGDVLFTGGHEQTIVAVNNGDIDAGVTWPTALATGKTATIPARCARPWMPASSI